jgi:hypothetical protein
LTGQLFVQQKRSTDRYFQRFVVGQSEIKLFFQIAKSPNLALTLMPAQIDGAYLLTLLEFPHRQSGVNPVHAHFQ